MFTVFQTNRVSFSEETINAAFGGILSKAELAPPNYKTPPYLTATPDVTSHKLTPRDKFLGKNNYYFEYG
jgi:hypothetical protein